MCKHETLIFWFTIWLLLVVVRYGTFPLPSVTHYMRVSGRNHVYFMNLLTKIKISPMARALRTQNGCRRFRRLGFLKAPLALHAYARVWKKEKTMRNHEICLICLAFFISSENIILRLHIWTGQVPHANSYALNGRPLVRGFGRLDEATLIFCVYIIHL